MVHCAGSVLLTWSEHEGEDDDEVEDVRARLPEHPEAVVPLEKYLTHEGGQHDLVEDAEHVPVFH